MWHPYPGFSDWAMADGLLIVFSNAKWERLKSQWETECRGNVVGTGPGWASTNLQIARVLFVFVSIRVNSWTTSTRTLGDRLRLLFEAHWGSTLGDRPRHFASQEAPFHLPSFPNSAHAGARPHARETNRWCTMPCARAQTLRSSASASTAQRLPFPKSR